MNTARTRKSFWLTAEDMAALMAMAGGESKSASEKLRELIRGAWARWPGAKDAREPGCGASAPISPSLLAARLGRPIRCVSHVNGAHHSAEDTVVWRDEPGAVPTVEMAGEDGP